MKTWAIVLVFGGLRSGPPPSEPADPRAIDPGAARPTMEPAEPSGDPAPDPERPVPPPPEPDAPEGPSPAPPPPASTAPPPAPEPAAGAAAPTPTAGPPVPSAAAVDRPSPDTPASPPHGCFAARQQCWRLSLAGIVVGSVGAVALGGGIGFVVAPDYPDPDRAIYDRSLDPPGVVMIAAGATALVTGAIMIAIGQVRHKRDKARRRAVAGGRRR